MRLLYLDWPHLPFRLEAERADLPELVVVGGQPWESGGVVDFSPAAGRLGIRRGQPLGTAHKLAPEARFMAADLPAYRQRFRAVIEALGSFTPALEADEEPAGPAFGRLLLGIEGLHLLWGEEPVLAQRLLDAVSGLLPGRSRLGIGNSRFGAQVAAVIGARQGRMPEAIPVGGAAVEAAYLAPLPIGLLPADDSIRERLRVFGLATIGDLAAISRSSVVARFGESGGLLHDLARGLDGRPLKPRRPIERLRAEAQLEPAVDELEPLRFVLRRLCGALCAQLAARGAGAGRAVLELELEDKPDRVRLEQPLPEPSAAAELLERLLLARLAAQLPELPVAGLSLELDRAAPAAGQQLGLFTPQLARAARLDWQLAGLTLRFGSDRIWQARLLDPETGLAERRFEWRSATAEPLSR
ncbi:MAG TPA: DNA polymerase Y family protein [Candidatus Limnocylindrales bacterium]|nr:DNA polymerase Y family protein [Candidatus Limnocylindrales bacterium]